MKGFSIAGGSVPGTDHIKPGQPVWVNNHDAFTWRTGKDFMVAVVCDGCGSGEHSEVGAKIGAEFVAKRIAARFGPEMMWFYESSVPSLLSQTQEGLIKLISEIARGMGSEEDLERIVENYFLFTIVGVLVSPDWTVTFSMGDGVLALNGDVHVIPPFPGNAPPYIGNYARARDPGRPLANFVRHQVIPTADVQSILIGSDGVGDLIEAEAMPLPGKIDLVGPLAQFWTDDKFIQNPDMIRRRLAVVNREWVDGRHIRKGLLRDDTTLVVIRRHIQMEE